MLPQIAAEIRSVGSDIIQIAVVSTNRKIERRARTKPEKRRQAQFAEPIRRIESAGKRDAVASVEQTARVFRSEISDNLSRGSIDNAVVFQTRQSVDETHRAAETAAEFTETVSEFKSRAFVKAVAD
jgi:hypothetical protein